MSRASALRDAMVTELETAFPAETIDAFILPSYDREEFEAGRRIGVRVGGREIELDQGVDERRVIIEVAVIGILGEKTAGDAEDVSATKAAYRAQEVTECDAFDALMESIIAKWTPRGPLRNKGIGDHRLMSISQPTQFDAEKLYGAGLWLSLLRFTFQDSLDE